MSETARGQMRRGIVEKSIQILRRHGKSSGEIRSIILRDFQINEEALNELLNKNAK